jgi:hypothetical protein
LVRERSIEKYNLIMLKPSAPIGAHLFFGAILLWSAICLPADAAICCSAPDIGAQTHHSAQLSFHNSTPLTSAPIPASLVISFSKESVWVGNRSICSYTPVIGAQNLPPAQISTYYSISLNSAPFPASLALDTIIFNKESVGVGNRSIGSSAPVIGAQQHPSAWYSYDISISLTSAPFPVNLATGNTSFNKESVWGRNRSICPHSRNFDASNDPSARLISSNSLFWNDGPAIDILPAGNTCFRESLSAGLGNRSISPHICNSDVFYDNIKLPNARLSHSGTAETPLLSPAPVVFVFS